MSYHHRRAIHSYQNNIIKKQNTQESDGEGETENRARCPTPETVLTVLSDPNARMIMRATADQWLSVSEIVSRCKMSTATAYRKVNRLVEAGMLTEETRIRPEGTNFREFRLRVDTVHVSFSKTGKPVVTLSPTSPKNTATIRPVSTDGGIPETNGEPTDKQERLQQLFREVTGTDEVTKTRDAAIQSRCIDSKNENSVSRYVTDIARDDGLSETLTEPES
jgi:DNA-binding transcriptional ArsR family regulator